jgi:hypothetical protein
MQRGRSSVVWNISQFIPLKIGRHFGVAYLHLGHQIIGQAASFVLLT